MTKRNKLRVLKKMKEILLRDNSVTGLCAAKRKACYELCINKDSFTMDSLGLYKPKKTHNCFYWWPAFDVTPRLRYLDRHIKKLEGK